MHANFQSVGKTPLERDLLYKIDKGKQIDSAVRLINSVGQPSGPGDLLLSKLFSLVNTICGAINNLLMIKLRGTISLRYWNKIVFGSKDTGKNNH